MKILITESQLLTILEQKPPQSVVKSFVKGLLEPTIEKGVKNFDFEKAIQKSKEELNQKKFNLSKQIEIPQKQNVKPKWDYKKVKINDNLTLIRNPKGGGMKYRKSTLRKVQNDKTNEYVDLKWDEDEFGVYYYMSANMKNTIDAGRAIEVLKKEIPSGTRFGEPITGSLSTDSYYSMLRRLKEFNPKIVGYINLNDQGQKKYREFVNNTIKGEYADDPMFFKTYEDAEPLYNALNKDIENAGLKTFALIAKDNKTGYYFIKIPNFHLIVK